MPIPMDSTVGKAVPPSRATVRQQNRESGDKSSGRPAFLPDGLREVMRMIPYLLRRRSSDNNPMPPLHAKARVEGSGTGMAVRVI